jgi:AraC-like DNA-binding protein
MPVLGEDKGMAQVHSVLVRAGSEPCAVTGRLAAPRLRPYVAGYSAFRAGAEAAGRRVLPLNLIAVTIDSAGTETLVTGARGTAAVKEDVGWRHGAAVGLTPAGARAVLGPPMRELTGAIIPLADLIGRRADELTGRLEAAPDWAARFSVLDDLLTVWLRSDREPDPLAAHGWRRLQQVGGRITVGGLAAELGVGRRRLETAFGQEIGLTPKTVARIARFQQAVQVLAAPPGTFSTAAACGYADQPHFNREMRAMAGITPTELRAFVQYTTRLTG